MKTTSNKTLKAAFMAVALITGMGVLPVPGAVQEAEAGSAVRAAMNSGHDREAINDVLVFPTQQNIEKISRRRIITPYQVGYVPEAVKEMNIHPGTKPESIPKETRSRFLNRIKEMHELDIVRSPSASEAQKKGLDRSLAEYFGQCTKDLQPVDQREAADAMKCMHDQHWEKNTKSVLLILGIGLLGLARVGFSRRR